MTSTETSNRWWPRVLCIAGLALPLACTGDTGSEQPASADPPAATQAAQPAGEPVLAQAADAAPYDVDCADDPETGARTCTVDKETFVGWRTYHAFCHVCHAQDAVGSTFAPSLVERLKVIDKARFMDAVENGYTGQIGVMPPWKDNPNISKNYDALYAYLKARSDGVLVPGRPAKRK